MRVAKIVVVGTGYVGLPAALMWAKSGFAVVGVDINENVVRAINEGTMLLKEQELQSLLEDPDVKKNLIAASSPTQADAFVIAVPTPVDSLKKVCNFSAVEAAIESICPFLKPGNLVILESTVPPRTCRDVVKRLIEKHTGLQVPSEVMVAHCPERILPGDIFQEIIHNDRLIGGMDDRSAKAAAELYAAFVKGQLHLTNDISAELSKLMENTYRDVNIALANEFAQICELVGVDVHEVIGFANKHPRVNILNPGIGVGGHCIPVDPWFIKEVAPYNSRIISMARVVNDEMPHRIAKQIRVAVRDITDPLIVCVGATYKRNCEDLRESPATEIVNELLHDGYRVRHVDPLVGRLNYSSLAEVASGADLVAILVQHDQVRQDLQANEQLIRSAMRTPHLILFDKP
jgi:UDP-N-acetyl-D-mannosaminuronic acid dehydrogenase